MNRNLHTNSFDIFREIPGNKAAGALRLIYELPGILSSSQAVKEFRNDSQQPYRPIRSHFLLSPRVGLNPALPKETPTRTPADVISLSAAPGEAAPPVASAPAVTAQGAPQQPEFGQLLNDLRDAQIVGYGRVSRGMPEPGQAVLPKRPQCFPAITKEIIFRSPEGVQQKLLIDAEGSLGHFTPIVPGDTTIPGARMVWQREGSPYELDQKECQRVLSQLYSNFARRQPAVQLDRLQEAVNMAAAVAHNGEGWEAVEQSYIQGLANVQSMRILFPDEYPGK